MKKIIGLLLITLFIVGIVACSYEEKNMEEEEKPKDIGKANQDSAIEDTYYDNPEVYEVDNGLTFSIQKDRQDDNWLYRITGNYEEKGYEMKNLKIIVGSDSWYVAEPSLHLEEDLIKQPFVIESEERLSSIDFSMSYTSKYGEEELDKSFNLQ